MNPQSEKPPEFFVDRSLGKSIVEGLRAAGLVVHSMADIYGEEEAQRLPDEVWLRDAGENDWIVLTKDDAIRRRPAERDALTAAEVRVFCLTTLSFAAPSRPSASSATAIASCVWLGSPAPISTASMTRGSSGYGRDGLTQRHGRWVNRGGALALWGPLLHRASS